VVAEAEGLVVVGQAAQLDLVAIPAADDCPVAAKSGRGLQVAGVAEGLVAGPAARMVSDELTVAVHPDPVQVGAELERRPTAAGWTE
jgi:hypothetical protein